MTAISLTTAQLAQRTGIPAGTLRVWQARHGFPEPASPGHGRPTYGEEEIAAVEQLVRLRAEGLSMSAAVARVRSARIATPASIYAGLRARRPDLAPQMLSKRALLALTHAIEDEHAARGGDGLLLGSFQQARHFRASQRRWRELARPTSAAVAIADFSRSAARPGPPIELSVSPEHPQSREWTLIACSSKAQACIAAWEVPAARPADEGSRQFEFVWSFDPGVVAAAVSAAVELLRALAPAVADSLGEWDGAGPTGQAPGFGADLTARAFAYLAAGFEPGPLPR
jgi:DICT domain-containing protein